ncbi:Protein prenyltransferase [Babesia duncani]|uniref:Protein prenyltransferase n=1 Tax=Babesia duncani TaxID=323732 RepID=A0AAD9UNE8_9APIC|nr:Protein prenyltransferase [Babesia duncani]
MSPGRDAILEESEGVLISVFSKNIPYPPPEIILDDKLLQDDSKWRDLIQYTHLKEKPPSQNLLFIIRMESSDELVSEYLAALLNADEFSQRGLYISGLAIKNNPANYSAWYYRMECINQMKLSINEELGKQSSIHNLAIAFARRVTYESPKSYQVGFRINNKFI